MEGKLECAPFFVKFIKINSVNQILSFNYKSNIMAFVNKLKIYILQIFYFYV